MYFDSHAHLDDKCFQPDFDAILARMRENGVTGMMNIGCDLPSSERSVALAEQYDWIWAAVGSHPDDADHVDEARIERYRALCQSLRVRAIGEIGLDYHYEDVPREVQKRAFRMQMALARELSLPVVVHEREHRGRIPRGEGRVPLLFRESGNGEGACPARLVHRLHGRHHVQKCTQGGRGGAVASAEPDAY